MVKIFLRVFPFIFIVVGLILVGFGVYNIYQANASEKWPTTTGEIVSSDVKRHAGEASKPNRRGGQSTTYSPDILFEYDIEGETYTSSKVAFGGVSFNDRADAQRIVDNYPVGKQVTVYYNPKAPDIAVLEVGMSDTIWLLPIFGSIFAGIGLVLFFVFRLMIKKME